MTQTPPAQPRPDIAGIQYLRGLAAIMVVVFHISFQVSRVTSFRQVDTLASGVDVFFVISGFVMIHSTRAGARFAPGEFLRHRLARIAPLYWAATLATIAVLVFAPFLVQTARLSPRHALLSLLFVASPNPVGGTIAPLVLVGWTLNLEMFFYVVFAAGIAIGRRSPPRVTGLVVAALCALAAIGLASHASGVAGFYLNPILLEFVFGIAVALAYRRRPAPWPRWALWLVPAALLVLLLPAPGEEALRCLRYGLPATLLVAAAIFVPLPRWRLPHRLGDISYSLYVSHFFTLSAVSQVWRRLPGAQGIAGIAAFYVAGTLGALIVGYACWRWIETPLTARAKRLLVPRDRRQAAAVG